MVLVQDSHRSPICSFLSYHQHKGRYGYRRINSELRRDGIVVSEKRVLAVMRKLGLQAKGASRRCFR
ncbi:IS3 family transposase [Collinsella bouchesdurhonensis]|uniref:IS3 family transposase n=1 Tax=Collinsella bouchesdurhonensis TaxID=1907654 RepID=UPI00058FBD46